MVSGWPATLKANRCGSFQVVTGSTKLPVEKLQWRMAPTPFPSILALIGYAIPALNNSSDGSFNCGNAMTFCQTFSGGVLITILVVTDLRVSLLALVAYSNPVKMGTDMANTTATSYGLMIFVLTIS